MLGWHISVFRQTDGGGSPAAADSKEGVRLAVWQTDVDGLGWLDELVKANQAIDLGGDGYPYYYTAQAKVLVPRILGGPPRAREHWLLDAGDIVTAAWEGKTFIDRAAVEACAGEEWLLVVVWDES
jgi:hypothetical protein